METKSPFDQFDELRIDGASKSFLAEAARWTTFLAILGFIGIGFMVLAGLFMITLGASISSYNRLMPMGGGIFFSLFYFIIAAFYFFPVMYLYRFGSNMKSALRSNNQNDLAKAFQYLKSHYKFIGILTIVIFGLYILMIFGTMIFAVGMH